MDSNKNGQPKKGVFLPSQVSKKTNWSFFSLPKTEQFRTRLQIIKRQLFEEQEQQIQKWLTTCKETQMELLEIQEETRSFRSFCEQTFGSQTWSPDACQYENELQQELDRLTHATKTLESWLSSHNCSPTSTETNQISSQNIDEEQNQNIDEEQNQNIDEEQNQNIDGTDSKMQQAAQKKSAPIPEEKPIPAPSAILSKMLPNILSSSKWEAPEYEDKSQRFYELKRQLEKATKLSAFRGIANQLAQDSTMKSLERDELFSLFTEQLETYDLYQPALQGYPKLKKKIKSLKKGKEKEKKKEKRPKIEAFVPAHDGEVYQGSIKEFLAPKEKSMAKRLEQLVFKGKGEKILHKCNALISKHLFESWTGIARHIQINLPPSYQNAKTIQNLLKKLEELRKKQNIPQSRALTFKAPMDWLKYSAFHQMQAEKQDELEPQSYILPPSVVQVTIIKEQATEAYLSYLPKIKKITSRASFRETSNNAIQGFHKMTEEECNSLSFQLSQVAQSLKLERESWSGLGEIKKRATKVKNPQIFSESELSEIRSIEQFDRLKQKYTLGETEVALQEPARSRLLRELQKFLAVESLVNIPQDELDICFEPYFEYIKKGSHFRSLRRRLACFQEEEKVKRIEEVVENPVEAEENEPESKHSLTSLSLLYDQLRPLTKGKKAFIIGPYQRDETKKRLEENLAFASLDWVASEKGRDRKLKTLARRIQSETNPIVILVLKIGGHGNFNILKNATKSANGFCCIPQTFGEVQIVHSIAHTFGISTDGRRV